MLNACVPESADVGLAAWTVDPATAIISASFATTVQYLAAVYYRPANDTAPLPSKVLIPNVIVGSWTNIQAALINIDQLGANSPGVTLAITAAVQAAAAGLNTLALTWAAAAPAVRKWRMIFIISRRSTFRRIIRRVRCTTHSISPTGACCASTPRRSRFAPCAHANRRCR